MPDEMVCPECGDECWRESCDVGVGIIYGPWGCPCGWGEGGRAQVKDGRYIDQFGGSWSVDRIVENCERFGISSDVVRDAFREGE